MELALVWVDIQIGEIGWITLILIKILVSSLSIILEWNLLILVLPYLLLGLEALWIGHALNWLGLVSSVGELKVRIYSRVYQVVIID